MSWEQILDDPTTTIAVVGATDSPGKYGGRIYRNLKSKGFRVFAVNPNRETVDDDPAYATLSDLPAKPDIVDLVVPSQVGARVAREAAELEIDRIWVQPGAEGLQLMQALDETKAEHLVGRCIMVEAPSHR